MTSARHPLLASFVALGRFLPMTLTLGLVAALGRTLQEGIAGPVSRGTFVALEILVESSRLLLVLHVLGMGSFLTGWIVLKGAVRGLRGSRAIFGDVLRHGWRGLLWNALGFLALAAVANIAIFAWARHGSTLAMLQHCGWVAEQAGPWVTVLFVKNLTIIPWTLVFVVATGGWIAAHLKAARGAG